MIADNINKPNTEGDELPGEEVMARLLCAAELGPSMDADSMVSVDVPVQRAVAGAMTYSISACPVPVWSLFRRPARFVLEYFPKACEFVVDSASDKGK